MKFRPLTYFISFVLVAQITSCYNGQKPKSGAFQISGSIKGVDKGVISVIEYTGDGEGLILDTTPLKKGEFVLKGTIKTQKPAFIMYDGEYELPFFLEEGETIMTLRTDSLKKRDFMGMRRLLADFKDSEVNIIYQKYLKTSDSVEALERFGVLNKLMNSYMNSIEDKDTMFVDSITDELLTISDEKDALMRYIKKQFAMRHNASIVAPYIMLYEYDGINDINYTLEELEQVFGNLDQTLTGNLYYQEFEAQIKVLKRLGNGKPAPEFSLKTPDGKSVSLVDFKGKYLLLDFWAPWCRPCTDNFSKVSSIKEHYRNQRFEVLGISDDPDTQIWKNAIEEHNLTWPQAIVNTNPKQGKSVSELYNIEYLPMYYLLDGEGKIIMKDHDIITLEEMLDDLFDEPTTEE